MSRLIETHNSMLKDLVLTNQLQIVMGILFKNTFSVNGKTIYIWNTKYRQQMTQAALINFDESKALLHGGCLERN